MSAYVVSDATIHVIIRAGISYGMVKPESADLVGQALLAANIASVTYRYVDVVPGGSMPGPIDAPPPVTWLGAPDLAIPRNGAYVTPATYRYQRRAEGEPRLDYAKVLGCIEALNYQSCEFPGWLESAAREFLHKLTLRITRHHPGIESSGWDASTIAEVHQVTA